MKNIIICILVFISGAFLPAKNTPGNSEVSAERPIESEEISYLGIGNSFTWNSTTYLRQIVASQGRELDFFVAGIGGATIEEHVRRIKRFEADPTDPEGRPYKRERKGRAAEYFSLRELLEEKEWSYISIQQRSRNSFSPATYEPFAGELVSYIRKYAPNSKVTVHMTWAYREDHDWFISGELTQEGMYDGLSRAYQKLADTYGLEIVPIGAAIQEARKMEEWTFRFPDPDFNYISPVRPDTPVQNGSLNRGWYWRENEETGEFSFRKDSNHANNVGCYLGGLVHFEFLFGEPVDEATVFRLKDLDDGQVKSLIEAAHLGIEQYRDFNCSVSR